MHSPALMARKPCTYAVCQHSGRQSTRVVRPLAFRETHEFKTGSPQSDGTGLASKKATTRVTIFSAAPYVTQFLQDPLISAGYENFNFIEAKLDKFTAKLAKESPLVCLFVNDNCDAEVVAELAQRGVKLIAMRCAGYDRVDVAACQQHGIQVARVPTYSPTSVAEHAVGLLFAINRRLALAHQRVMAGNYSLSPLVGSEVKGKRVGVLGTGAIGAEAVRIFKGLGMEVMAYDVRKNPVVEALGVPYMDMDDILPQADVVSVHVPLLPSTYHFIDKDKIDKMKQGCILLNVSRGGLVDSDALLNGLESGQLGGVGLDVYENEGTLFFTDWTEMDLKIRMKSWDRRFKVLTSYPQVLITPHSAFLTHEALHNIATTTINNMTEFLEGKPLKNVVNP
eukprot:GHRR01014623.1.p1 GENE.GHRR01014623.1~~GHRR01014623.1.p1  ORF type:complete len:430 (+),score=91.56 GHRR01014623.1:107-1291(+)